MALNQYSEGPGLAKKETLLTTLIDVGQCLGECQAMLAELLVKIHGPAPQVDVKQEQIQAGGGGGIAATAMDLRNRAQQIRTVLGSISSELA